MPGLLQFLNNPVFPCFLLVFDRFNKQYPLHFCLISISHFRWVFNFCELQMQREPLNHSRINWCSRKSQRIPAYTKYQERIIQNFISLIYPVSGTYRQSYRLPFTSVPISLSHLRLFLCTLHFSDVFLFISFKCHWYWSSLKGNRGMWCAFNVVDLYLH